MPCAAKSTGSWQASAPPDGGVDGRRPSAPGGRRYLTKVSWWHVKTGPKRTPGEPVEIDNGSSPIDPVHAASTWREHDLQIRRFHLAGLIPAEIAVVLASKGLRVKTWHVSETFVRNRLAALGFRPNISREIYAQGVNRYRPKPKFRDPESS